MKDFNSDSEAAHYALGYLRARHARVDVGSPEAAAIVQRVVGDRALGDMSREAVEAVADEVATAWKDENTLGGTLDAWQKAAGL